jgi:hypothetical protein
MTRMPPPGFNIPDQPRFTLDEVAAISGFGVRAIKDGCRAKRIKHHWFGRERFLTREQLFEFLASTEVVPEVRPASRVVGVSQADTQRVAAHTARVAARLDRKRRVA